MYYFIIDIKFMCIKNIFQAKILFLLLFVISQRNKILKWIGSPIIK